MTPRAFVPAVCVPFAAMLLAGGLSSDSTAMGITAVIGSLAVAASAGLALEADTGQMRECATSLFLTTLWSIALIAIVRLVLS